MSLNVDARTASAKAKKNLFNAGMTVMSIGLGEVNTKNVKEAQFRLDLSAVIYGEASLFTAQDLIGVKINGHDETFRQWIGRIYDNRVKRNWASY
jgi:hypothetical protein